MSGDLLYVAVCGPDPCSPEVAGLAEEVGRLLARAGAILVCGGLGGTMEAAARGATGEGGTVIGLLPGDTRTAGNPYLTLSIPTGMGEMRNALLVRSADALVAVAGEHGTLSEIAFALKTGVPVIGLKTWELAKAGRKVEAFVEAASPEEAAREAVQAARRRRATTRPSSGSGSP
ncbi:MAG: TIGR00725 family protein [Actinobacteria bacterium]|nr:MAG: TIGR00725 family protein [Actinomycetota bacterium]